jgi:hypothetical protein
MVGGAEEGLCGFLKDIIFECCVDSIGIQETMLKTYSHSFLRHLSHKSSREYSRERTRYVCRVECLCACCILDDTNKPPYKLVCNSLA